MNIRTRKARVADAAAWLIDKVAAGLIYIFIFALMFGLPALAIYVVFHFICKYW